MRAAFIAAATLAACAPASRPAGTPAPVRLGAVEVEQIATLLRLEDRRQLDTAALHGLTAAPSATVRRFSAMAIGRIGGSGSGDLLLSLLADRDTTVAAAAAFALGQLGDTAATPALVTWLAPERAAAAPTVAAEAAAALGKARSEQGRATLAAFLDDAPVDDARLRPAVEAALLALWKYPRAQQPAAPFVRWTRAADPEVRWRATYALVRRPDPAATAALVPLAADRDARVRALAARGLTAPLADSAGIATETLLPVLVEATRDADYAVRINAARSLGTFAAPRAVAALVELLETSDSHLAWAAAEALGRTGDAGHAAAAPLRRLAEARSRPVALRGAALLSLAEIAPSEAEAVAGAMRAEPEFRARSAAARAYATIGPVPRTELVALMRDADPRVAAAALDAAVAALDSVAPLRDLLLESLGHADVMVRAAALAGLAKLRDAGTIPALLDAYAVAQRDTMNDAALAAVDAVAALHSAPAVRAFLARFPRPADALVRSRAAAAFGDAATGAWGAARPVETQRTAADYARIAHDLVAAPLAGAPLPRARIETTAGVIEIELLAPAAPLTVLNFLGLAERGYFDGQEWPRVVPNFVIQGGDPRGDTSGGPGYAIRDEINRVRYERGTVGMALAGPDTGGSQFFVTHSAQPHLDGTYTVFGRVVGGMEVVDRVLPGERIERITRTR